MAVPKQKTSRSRRNHRRSHHKMEIKPLTKCNNCGNLHICHHACDKCGFYKGRKILNIK